MTIANKLYDRSHGFVGDVSASNPDGLPALYLTGPLPDAPTGSAYEGRLQIHNAVGDCKAKLLSGNLPPGYTISVDNVNSQVVIKWPSFKSGTVDIPNANFEKGDDGSWELGAGFTIESGGTAPDPNDAGSTKQLQFANLIADPDGPQTMSTFYAPVENARQVGQNTITASVDVQQGASSANHAGAAVRVLFYDNVGFKIGGMDGNVIKSGSDSNWQTSTVNAPIPPSAQYARVGAVAFRKSQNRPLWIDNIKWNLVQPALGTITPGDLPLSVQVTDSLGRVAIWSDSIHMPEVFIEALHYFNTNPLLDDTGNTWSYNINRSITTTQGTITDRWGGQPALVPYLTNASPISNDFAQTLEGAASLSTCPDSKNHDGTYDYQGWSNIGLLFQFGTKAPTKTDDFCIEMFFRRNELSYSGNTGVGFILLAGMRFAARLTTDTYMTMESGNWTDGISPLTVIYDNNANTKPLIGPWMHHAITRQGDIVTAYMNGVKYIQWSGGSNWNIASDSSVLIGHVNGSVSSYLGFGGQYDGFRYTRNWSRYNGDFTPPTLPY